MTEKVKCELCDGKGWLPINRTILFDTGIYIPKAFKQTCSWCDGTGEVPPIEEENDE